VASYREVSRGIVQVSEFVGSEAQINIPTYYRTLRVAFGLIQAAPGGSNLSLGEDVV
jgi:hypothetical protein